MMFLSGCSLTVTCYVMGSWKYLEPKLWQEQNVFYAMSIFSLRSWVLGLRQCLEEWGRVSY
jgi:hypothetical protein